MSFSAETVASHLTSAEAKARSLQIFSSLLSSNTSTGLLEKRLHSGAKTLVDAEFRSQTAR